MFADLHCHTRMSDGSTGITEIISIAKKIGLQAISITDHDTFAGSTRAQVLGKRYNLNVIPGAEISAIDNKRNRRVHILCYMCEHTGRLEGMLKSTAESRKNAAAIMLQKIMQLYPINPDMVSYRAKESTNVFKQHIMHALMDAGYTSKIYSDLYNKFFDSQNGIAYVKIDYPDVFEVVEKIHDAGGVAILAHPSRYNSYELLEELIEIGIDGVEVWHPSNSEEDIAKLQKLSKEYDLIMTGGSDFHGMYSSKMVPIGNCTTPIEQIEKMIERCKVYS